MTLTWKDLFTLTLRAPAEAAQFILGTYMVRRDIYMALIAGAALNALITGLSLLMFPLPSGWPDFIGNPISYFIISAGGLALFAHILTWAGRALGGHGEVDDLLKLMVWLQYVRVALQVVGLGLSMIIPVLAGIYSLIVTGLSLWIVLHFIQAGHRLTGLGNAAVVLFITFIGLIFSLAVLLAILGGTLGVVPNV